MGGWKRKRSRPPTPRGLVGFKACRLRRSYLPQLRFSAQAQAEAKAAEVERKRRLSGKQVDQKGGAKTAAEETPKTKKEKSMGSAAVREGGKGSADGGSAAEEPKAKMAERGKSTGKGTAGDDAASGGHAAASGSAAEEPKAKRATKGKSTGKGTPGDDAAIGGDAAETVAAAEGSKGKPKAKARGKALAKAEGASKPAKRGAEAAGMSTPLSKRAQGMGDSEEKMTPLRECHAMVATARADCAVLEDANGMTWKAVLLLPAAASPPTSSLSSSCPPCNMHLCCRWGYRRARS